MWAILILMVSAVVVYLISNRVQFQSKRSQKANFPYSPQSVATSRIEVERNYKRFYENETFTNKGKTNKADFIIDDTIGKFDLMLLADLNGIQLQIREGWYPLLISLLKALDKAGWASREVSCIKEKYAKLMFYTEYRFTDILDRYEEISGHVCEICGERGKIRYGGWDYAACRKHYLEGLKKVSTVPDGFVVDGNDYHWHDVVSVSFGKKNHLEKYEYASFVFNKKIKSDGYSDKTLVISNSSRGYGALLSLIPKTFSDLDYNYISAHFSSVGFCKVCGYEAVYFGACECCENFVEWTNEIDRLKLYQMDWVADEGERYENIQQNYCKNPDYEIVYSRQELEEHLPWLKQQSTY